MGRRAFLAVALVALVPGQPAVHRNGAIVFVHTQVVAPGGIASIDSTGGRRQLLFASNLLDTGVASPDGSRLACIQPVAPSWTLYVVRTDGAPRVRIGPISPAGGPPSWSPDGSRLVFAGPGGALEVATADVGAVRQLGVSGAGPAWSPRGDWIAFTTPGGSIDLIRPDGTGHTVLSTDPNGHGQSWSHDGAWLAFAAEDPVALHNQTIVVKPDGTGRQTFADTAATWSPTADVLALARSDTGALELASPDGSVLLTPSIGAFETMVWSPRGDALAVSDQAGNVALVDARTGAIRQTPLVGDVAWSPDGLRLAAVPWNEANGPATLSVAAASGGPAHVIARGAFQGTRVQWLPSGRIVFFTQERDRDVIDTQVEGGRPRPLLHGPTTFFDRAKCDFGALSWSPDGRRLAVMRNQCGAPQLAVVGANGRRVRMLANGADGVPAWSPDGRWIAYGTGGIDIVRSSGGPTKRLTNGNDSSATWSPDGRWIAYLRQLDDGYALFVIHSSGGRPRRLAHVYAEPSWSPDGRRLAFVTQASGTFRLDTIGPDGTGLERVTSDPDSLTSPSWSPDGRWILSSVNDTPLLVRPDGVGRHQVDFHLDEASWSPDGTQLLGVRPGELVAVDVRSDRTRFAFASGKATSWSWQPLGS